MKLKNDFKGRPSMAGTIMTKPDADTLPRTVISFVHAWLKTQPEFYDRTHEFTNKYVQKGNECEDDAIEFAARVLGWPEETEKNETLFENDHSKGTPDVLIEFESVEDIKNSYTEQTFPLFYSVVPNHHYWCQLQDYMDLTGERVAGLVYTLMDAPEHLVEREAMQLTYERGLDQMTREIYDEVKRNMTFSNLPDHLRLKRFEFYYDAEWVRKYHRRIRQINEYIETLPEILRFV